MNPSAGSERRRDPRATKLGIQAMVLVRHDPGVWCSIENLSVGGAAFVGPLALSQGDQIQILFEVEGRPIDLAADVIRIEHVDVSSERVAVCFMEVEAPAHKLIQRLVARAIAHARVEHA